jgi:hypothetical protein
MSKDCDSFHIHHNEYWGLFNFSCIDSYSYCRFIGLVGLFSCFYCLFFFSGMFVISFVKSVYDLIISEIKHRDVPLYKWTWKKMFHCLLPIIQLFQFAKRRIFIILF